MGAIIRLTETAAPYGAEVRSESFYLNSPDRFRPVDGGVAIPVGDRDAIVSALEQVSAHPAVAGIDPDASVSLTVDGEWIAILGGDWLHVYGAGKDRSGCIEISYTHMGALRSALGSVGA